MANSVKSKIFKYGEVKPRITDRSFTVSVKFSDISYTRPVKFSLSSGRLTTEIEITRCNHTAQITGIETETKCTFTQGILIPTSSNISESSYAFRTGIETTRNTGKCFWCWQIKPVNNIDGQWFCDGCSIKHMSLDRNRGKNYSMLNEL